VDVDEHDAWRVRGEHWQRVSSWKRFYKNSLEFVRFEPYVIPKKSLTGDSTERVDTRVLQVIYRLRTKTLLSTWDSKWTFTSRLRTRRTRLARVLIPRQDTGNETVELGLVRIFQLSCWLAARLGQTTSGHKLRCQDSGRSPQLAEPPRLQLTKMTGGLRSKTRSSIHSSSGPPNKTWTSSWLSNVYRKLEQHEASLVRVISFHRRSGLCHP